MKKYIINGGKNLSGEITISGSKNIILKALIAACLTDEEVVIHNVPLIDDFFYMLELVKEIGGTVELSGHTLKVRVKEIQTHKIPLEVGAKIKTSSMFLAPLLARKHEAMIPNPGGCRIGARPIDRHIKGLEAMGAEIGYYSDDGYFHATTKGLHGTDFTFDKNTHTGTETLIIAAACAEGRTVLHNAAQEHEVDDLIELLNKMGAKIERTEPRIIVIDGVKKLHGATHEILSDSNELVTFAIASALTGGQIHIKNANLEKIQTFLDCFEKAGGEYEKKDGYVRFFIHNSIKPVDIVTAPEPGFKTDWQSLWAVFMTQADGETRIHETVYENRFGFVSELKKMGAKIEIYKPDVENPEELYNFNFNPKQEYRQGVKIIGKTPLHNGVLYISDLRAGATLVIAALIAKGESVIYGVEQIERGYEDFDTRLRQLGADIRVEEEI
jgi:UDP-N-acetylglucosamine 1-carboxyvinyltransferase